MNPASTIPKAREEFAALAKANEASLLRVARRMCGDPDLAMDLVQDTFVSGYRAYLDGRFDGRHPLAWLIRILTNAILLHHRNNRVTIEADVERIVEGQAVAPAWGCRVEGTDDNLLKSTLAEPLEKALKRLSEEQRICVLLIDIEEMTYAEVAEILQVPIGTVRSRLNRARLDMYTYLTKTGGLP